MSNNLDCLKIKWKSNLYGKKRDLCILMFPRQLQVHFTVHYRTGTDSVLKVSMQLSSFIFRLTMIVACVPCRLRGGLGEPAEGWRRWAVWLRQPDFLGGLPRPHRMQS